MNSLTIAVTGGRDHYPTTDELSELSALIRHIHQSFNYVATIFVHGAARGVDTLIGEWAKVQGFTVKPYPIRPIQDGYSRSCGCRRNERMLTDSKPDALIAFPGGTGTADCVRRAIKKGIKVYYVGY